MRARHIDVGHLGRRKGRKGCENVCFWHPHPTFLPGWSTCGFCLLLPSSPHQWETTSIREILFSFKGSLYVCGYLEPWTERRRRKCKKKATQFRRSKNEGKTNAHGKTKEEKQRKGVYGVSLMLFFLKMAHGYSKKPLGLKRQKLRILETVTHV